MVSQFRFDRLFEPRYIAMEYIAMEWHRCFFVIWSWVWVNQWNIIAFPKNHFRRSSSWWLNRHARQIGTLWSISQSVGVKMSNIFETDVIHVWITYTLPTGTKIGHIFTRGNGWLYVNIPVSIWEVNPASHLRRWRRFLQQPRFRRRWEDVESCCRSLVSLYFRMVLL